MAHYYYRTYRSDLGHRVYRDDQVVAGPFARTETASAQCERLAKAENAETATYTTLPSEIDLSHLATDELPTRSCWKVRDPAAVALGSRGGSRNTAAQNATRAANGKRGGRPRKNLPEVEQK